MAGSGRAPRDGTNPVPRRARRSRGAALIEAALVLPVLFLVIFGTIEMGWMMKSYSGASSAIAVAGRTASIAGNDAMADATILARLDQEVGGLLNDRIEYVIIWDASGVGDSPPAACRNLGPGSPSFSSVGQTITTGDGSCNVYSDPAGTNGAFDLAAGRGPSSNPATYFGCSSAADAGSKLDCAWRPGSRNATISPRVLPTGCTVRKSPDFVGVYIAVEHSHLTGIIGDSMVITDQSINLIEPSGFSC